MLLLSQWVEKLLALAAVNRAYHMSIDTTELRKKKKKLGVDFKELSDKYTEHKITINSNSNNLFMITP